MISPRDITILTSDIRSRLKSSTTPIIVTVSGPSGSGKSHFVSTIQHTFPDSLVLSTDDYYIGKTRMKTEMPADEELNFDHPNAIDTKRLMQDIRQLKSGNSIDAPQYNMLISEPSTETKHILSRPLIIVEGIIANHPALRSLNDISICVTAPFKIRLGRRIERDKIRKNHTPEETREYMLNVVEPAYEKYYSVHETTTDFMINNQSVD